MRAIDGLPPATREALVLRGIHHASYDEVARQVGVEPATARKRAQMARDRVRARLDAGDEAVQGVSSRIVATRAVLVRLPSGTSAGYHLMLEERLPQGPVRICTLRRYVAEHPAGRKYRQELANLLYATGEWAEAADHYTEVLRKHPERTVERLRAAHILAELGRHADAAAHYRAFAAVGPDPGDALMGEGLALLAEGRGPEGVRRLEAAVGAARDAPRALRALALACQSLHMDHEAEEAFHHALACDPDDLVALVGSHNSLLALNRRSTILERMHRAVSLDGFSVDGLRFCVVHRCWWGRVRKDEGRKTLEMVRRAIRLAPDYPPVWEALANYHYARGEGARQAAVWPAFLKRNPGCAFGWYHFSGVAPLTGDL